MDALVTLADGDTAVRTFGAHGYFEEFFDFIDDDSRWDWKAWSSFTPAEVSRLADASQSHANELVAAR